ncbi:putative oxidoreductase [Cladobotryum mycophilum]|uniref:Oxidoreductase n=1 Tax=Cladobotryum mycophilum TaxID=491253 RepID=A0ABR0SG54_9HYPO
MATPKVFIVTGASKGIGAAVVQYLLGQSHKVVLSARSQDLLEKVKQTHPSQVEFIAGDMASPDIAQKLTDLAVTSFGKIDGLVINHGVLQPQKLDTATIEDIRHLYDINFFSYLAIAKASLKELKKSKGSIVWVSSGAAVKAYVSWGAYSSSKAAINLISQGLAAEEPDITSIAIAPGRVDTEMQALIRSQGKESMDEAQYDSFVKAFEEGALLKPEQPGHVMAKFVSDPQHDLSGKFLSWNSPELAAYQAEV